MQPNNIRLFTVCAVVVSHLQGCFNRPAGTENTICDIYDGEVYTELMAPGDKNLLLQYCGNVLSGHDVTNLCYHEPVTMVRGTNIIIGFCQKNLSVTANHRHIFLMSCCHDRESEL